MKNKFDEVVQEYIDFVNQQVGVYMDAIAGFEGHKVRIERQVHRVNRPTHIRKGSHGEPVIVSTSYEDPSKPDIILNRIIRADDYIAANSKGGLNEQQQARAFLIFLFTYWEEEVRPRLAQAKGVEINNISLDIMGDLRIVRHAILHAKAIICPKEHKRLKKLQTMFPSETSIQISYEDMHQIAILIKQGLASLLFDWLGVKDAPISPEEIVSLAIQKTR